MQKYSSISLFVITLEFVYFFYHDAIFSGGDVMAGLYFDQHSNKNCQIASLFFLVARNFCLWFGLFYSRAYIRTTCGAEFALVSLSVPFILSLRYRSLTKSNILMYFQKKASALILVATFYLKASEIFAIIWHSLVKAARLVCDIIHLCVHCTSVQCESCHSTCKHYGTALKI